MAFLPAWLIYGFLFTIGAVIGSFLNVCIYRIAATHLQSRYPDGGFWIQFKAAFRQAWLEFKALSSKPSHCPRCKTEIRWYDNIPIFGWLKLKGRCRSCKMWISPRYPSIELLNACLWVLVFWLEVPHDWRMNLSQSCLFTPLGPQKHPGLGWMSPETFVLSRYLFHMLLIEALLVASFIDFDHRVIPDGTTVPLMCIAVFASTAIGRLHLIPVWFQSNRLLRDFAIITPNWMHPLMDGPEVPLWINSFPHVHGFVVSLVGLIIGGGIVWVVRLFGFWLLKQEAIGFGDVMLMGMVGSFLGWQASIIAFFLAGIIATIIVLPTTFMRTENEIPYGPYLSVGSLMTILFWNQLFDRFSNIFNLGVLFLLYAGLMLLAVILSMYAILIYRRLMGIELEPHVHGRWSAGDQNWFFAGEHVDRHQGRWKQNDWEGNAAGHGTVHEERWKNGGSSGNGHLSPRRNRLE